MRPREPSARGAEQLGGVGYVLGPLGDPQPRGPVGEVPLGLGHLQPVEVDEHQAPVTREHAARGQGAVAEHQAAGGLVDHPGPVDRERRLDERLEHDTRCGRVGCGAGDLPADRPRELAPVTHPVDDDPTAVEVGQQVADLHGAGDRPVHPSRLAQRRARHPGGAELAGVLVEAERLRHPRPARATAAHRGGPQGRHRRVDRRPLGAGVALDDHGRAIALLDAGRSARLESDSASRVTGHG
jgi:hypothetical protein